MPRDVLIHTTESRIAHKRRENIEPGHTPFWEVNGTPRQTEPGQRIWFEADGRLIATAEILDVERGKLWFEPLRGVDAPAPVDPPTRGFTYVDGDGEAWPSLEASR